MCMQLLCTFKQEISKFYTTFSSDAISHTKKNPVWKALTK